MRKAVREAKVVKQYFTGTSELFIMKIEASIAQGITS